jgi:hypothetical protein
MKRVICFLLSIVFASLLFVGCSTNKKAEAEDIVKVFIMKMYTLEDYKEIKMEKFNLEYPHDQYTNQIRKISTDKALEEFIADRTISFYLNRLYALHINLKVTYTTIDKQSIEKDGSIVFAYKIKSKITFADTNEEKEEEMLGQITVKKIKENWFIIKFNKVEVPAEILKK